MIPLRRYLDSNRGNFFLNQIRTDSGSRADWARAIHLEVTRCCGEAGMLSRGDTKCGIIVIVAGDKTLRKMRKNRMGWRIEQLQAIAEENLVEWRRPGRGGSHVIFSAPGVREIVSVPAKRPIKPVYIKQFLALIDAAGGIRTR